MGYEIVNTPLQLFVPRDAGASGTLRRVGKTTF
jgi:hypothetical protein